VINSAGAGTGTDGNRDATNQTSRLPGAVLSRYPAARSSHPKAAPMKSPATATAASTSASKLIDQRIAELGDWRGKALARMRALIKAADPDVVEEWKWMGTPVWSHDGILCTGESYKAVVKLTFAKGASLPDPTKLFNSSLEGNMRRAIDLREGEELDAAAFTALIHAAIALNGSSKKAPKASVAKNAPTPAAKKAPTPTATAPAAKKPTAKKPTAKKPTAKKPTAKKPTAKKPTAKKPTAKKPTAKKPAPKRK
jgi:hypothetical protein